MAKSKKDNMSIPEKLKALYELQLIDSETDEIKVLKGELPIEVQDLEDEIAGLHTRFERLETQLKELGSGVAQHENNIKTAESNIERYETQLNEVKNNREYEALTKEIELQRLDIQLFNKRIKEARYGLETKEQTLAAVKERVTQKEKDLEVKKGELEKIIIKTEKTEAKLIRKSDRARKKIEDRLLKGYEKVRSNYRNGLAVVTVDRDSCGGCFNRIPPQLQLEIAQRKKIQLCEHCGRILVDDYILQDPVEEVPTETK